MCTYETHRNQMSSNAKNTRTSDATKHTRAKVDAEPDRTSRSEAKLKDTLEISFNWIETFCRELVLYDFPSVVCSQNKSFLPTCNVSFSEVVIEFEWRATYFGSLRSKLILACQNEFDPPWTDTKCSMFKLPHYLYACTKNLPNMASFVSKTINFLPKSWWVKG